MRPIVALVLAAIAASPAFGAGNPAAGEAKAKSVCAACHGPDGNSPTSPEFPKLAGQYYDYMVRALNEYKSGARKNAIMAGQVQPLTAKEIEDLAAYYAAQKGSLYTKR
ncbi:MAG: cytochrome c [Burkholderiales bacterium]|nr:cytochrome c [Burkholderiales bacterium]